jgi:hypothetical protein
MFNFDKLDNLGDLDNFDLELGNGLDLDMRMDQRSVRSPKIKKGQRISLPGRMRKAKITRVLQGTPSGFPDRLDASLGKASFVLRRVDGALFDVFEKRRGVEVKIGKKRF